MIAVIDYGGGNVGSLVSALARREAEFVVTEDPQVVVRSDAAILPGDGAFAATMQALAERGLDAAVRDVIARERPFLGICVGMQLLFERSEEYGDCAGFGYFPGTVARFEHAPRVPHMGWNALEILASHPFVQGVRSGEHVYFLHSYRAPVNDATVAAATYGERFAAVVAEGHIMGTQFHPEKSQAVGAALLDNFLKTANA